MNVETRAQRQLAWVFDLNRCIGCQTCSVACKVLWTRDAGSAHMWWCTVNTQPGRGTPRDWEHMGGGYDAEGKPVPGACPPPRSGAMPGTSTGKSCTPGVRRSRRFFTPPVRRRPGE